MSLEPAFLLHVFIRICDGAHTSLAYIYARKWVIPRLEEIARYVGLAHYRDRPYTQLSGGERQLVLSARGLAQKCRILLMDEPDAHLDLNNQQIVMEIVQQLAAEGLSLIVTSHVPNNALVYAHQILLMKAGRVLSNGEPAYILTEPLLSSAYDMDTKVIYEMLGELHIARAILPRKRP